MLEEILYFLQRQKTGIELLGTKSDRFSTLKEEYAAISSLKT